MKPPRAFYPATLDLSGAGVLVLGGGEVAHQKLNGLPLGTAWVRVVAPSASPAVRVWVAKRKDARLDLRPFEAGDLRGARLVFCCTPDAEVNAYAARQARALGAWCCQAAEPGQGDLRVPARIDAAGLQMTLSTGGASPALAKALRRYLEQWLGAGDLAFVLGELDKRRAELKADPKAKARLLKALTAPKALEMMLSKRSRERHARLAKLLRS